MRKFFGLDPEMLFPERVARITIWLSLIIMLVAPIPIIFFMGAGPAAFVYPFLIIPGFYTLKGTCRKENLFHYLFLLACASIMATFAIYMTPFLPVLFAVLLFCFFLYFQAERRLYYLLEMKKLAVGMDESSQDLKKFCKVYLLNCCKNAVLPTIIGCLLGGVVAWFATIAWIVSGVCFFLFLGIYMFIMKKYCANF